MHIAGSYDTIAQIKALSPSAGPAFAYCAENGKTYRYVADAKNLTGDGSAPTADDLIFLTTGIGSDSRWFCADALPYVRLDKNGTNQTGVTTALITWAATNLIDKFKLVDLAAAGDPIGPGIGGSNNGLPLGEIQISGWVATTAAVDASLYSVRINLNGSTWATCGSDSSGTGAIRIPIVGNVPITAASDYITFEAVFPDSKDIVGTVGSTFITAQYTHVSDWRES